MDNSDGTTTITMKNCNHQFKVSTNGEITQIEDFIDESIDTSLVLPKNLPVGTYSLKYENLAGIMTEYADICLIEKKNSKDEVSYDGFIKENIAPIGATKIGVYNSSNEKVAEIDLGYLDSSNIKQKKYSFAAISDTHIINTNETASNKLKHALQYFENSSDNIEFINICGDMATSGTSTNLNIYKDIVNNNSTKPIYAISGNHEASNKDNPLKMNSLISYTGQDLYYSYAVNNDVFIMLGISNPYGKKPFLDEELQWLYETLETNRNKRCFVFLHLYPRDGSGDAIDLDLEGDMLNNTQGKVFYSLISHYSNVIYFHGHSHEQFEIQEVNKMNNYDNIFGCHSIHIPSLGMPKKIENSNLVNYNGSEGYIVDVYENNIILKGRDFITDKFLPIASYSLDTKIKNVEANTYYDSTGTIKNSNSNTLKSGSTWYNSTVDKSTITEITFAKTYSGTCDESWKAGIEEYYNVTVYRIGTKLTIVGNQNGVNANQNSKEMFLNFKNLEKINSIELLNTTNIVELDSMFKNCSKLSEISLEGFVGVKPKDNTMTNVFSGCSSLTSIDISKFDLTDVNKFLNLFYNCSSLKNVKWNNNISSKATNIYLTNMFYNCTSLEKMDLSVFSGKNLAIGGTFRGCSSLTNITFGTNKILLMGSAFRDCSSLKSLDFSKLDTSKVETMEYVFENCVLLESLTLSDSFNTQNVTNMYKMFSNCPKLTLDCSGWDTTKLTNISAFNEGSPNVIVPVIK